MWTYPQESGELLHDGQHVAADIPMGCGGRLDRIAGMRFAWSRDWGARDQVWNSGDNELEAVREVELRDLPASAEA